MGTIHTSNAARTLQGVGATALAAVLLLAGSVAFAGDRGGSRAAAQRPTAASRPSLPDRAQRPVRPVQADRPSVAAGASAETTVERTEDGMTRTTTVTNGQGETRTSTTTVSRDADSRSVDVERTGFDGRTSSVSRTTERTDDGFERTLEVTRPDGETMTREMTVSRDADGNRVVEGTQTGFDGETRTFSGGPNKAPDAQEDEETEEDGGG